MISKILGTGVEKMPDFVFRLMEIIFSVYYLFKSAGKVLSGLGITKNDIVADWGCGTGAYVRPASEMTGSGGKVYAVDVHELSIKAVKKIISKYDLKNVVPVLSNGVKTTIPDNEVNIVFAIDMFHMVKDPDLFLREICRITKPDGSLYLENGHQRRTTAREKVLRSGCWKIIREDRRFMKCTPIKINQDVNQDLNHESHEK